MKNLTQKKGFEIGYSFLLNAIIMLFILLFFRVYYEMSDDAVLVQHITDGFKNYAYVNYFTVNFLILIQKLIFPLNAYTLFCLILAYLSCVTISKIFLERFDIKKATIITFVINGIFAANYYCVISFTRLPGIIAAAGFLAIIHYTRKEKWFLGTLWGVILVIVSSMVRLAVFELVLGMAISFVAAISFNDFFSIEKGKRKIIDFIKIVFEPKRLICAILIVASAFSLNSFSNSINNHDSEFASYREYTRVRSNLYDYQVPTYEEASDIYDFLILIKMILI